MRVLMLMRLLEGGKSIQIIQIEMQWFGNSGVAVQVVVVVVVFFPHARAGACSGLPKKLI